jgi:membrane protease YdiL (CAAX protease family)
VESLPVQPDKPAAPHLLVIGHWLWRHLSLLLILASWAWAALRRRIPRDVADWSFARFFAHALAGTAVTLVVIWLLLKHDGQKLSDLGLRKPQLKKSFVPGILFGFAIFVISNVLLPQFSRHWFPASEPVQTHKWFQTWSAIPGWILLGWFGGGLTEEISRAFVLTRFERTFARAGLITALVLSSVVFGIGHLYQGQRAAFDLGITGALYALVYLRRRSCWEAAIAHATFDTIGHDPVLHESRPERLTSRTEFQRRSFSVLDVGV